VHKQPPGTPGPPSPGLQHSAAQQPPAAPAPLDLHPQVDLPLHLLVGVHLAEAHPAAVAWGKRGHLMGGVIGGPPLGTGSSEMGHSRPPVPVPLGCSASMSRVMQTFPITSSRLGNKSREQDTGWDQSPLRRRAPGRAALPHVPGGTRRPRGLGWGHHGRSVPRNSSATVCCQLENNLWK